MGTKKKFHGLSSVLFVLLFTILLGLFSTSFASGTWDLSSEKDLFKRNMEIFANINPNGSEFIRSSWNNDVFIDNLFFEITTFMQNSAYSQSSYPYMLVRMSDSQIRVTFSKRVNIVNTIPSQPYTSGNISLYDSVGVNFTLDENNNITNRTAYSSSSYWQIISGTNPVSFFLADSYTQSTVIDVMPTFAKNSLWGKAYSSSEIGTFDPLTLNNNFILNKELLVGNNFDYDLKYYYFDNNEKIYITDYVTTNITNLWWGKEIQPYVSSVNAENIPQNEYFYYDLIVNGRTPLTVDYELTQELAFITFSSTTPPPDVPGEGGTTGTTGTITDSSGEETGKIDLEGIEQGINQTNQQLEELNQNITTVPDISDTIITDSDITNSLNFDFRGDPYSSFWLDLTTGLSGALTNNVRSINVEFRGKFYEINLDDFALQVPQPLKVFLAILSTVFIFWKMIKYVKVTVDNIMSGNMDEVLEMNEEEGIVDLF